MVRIDVVTWTRKVPSIGTGWSFRTLVTFVAAFAVACSNSTSAADQRADVEVDVADDNPAGSVTGPGDPAGVGDCAGSFDGTYEGGDSGQFNAIIDPNGGTRLVFLSSGAGFSIEGFGAVDAQSQLAAASSSGAESVGTLDTETCSATGTWANADLGISGTWEMTRVSDSLSAPPRFSGCEPGSGPDFFRTVLIRPNFADSDLRCGDFALAELAQPDFTNAQLDGAVFRGADLEEPIFSGTSLVGADLRGVVLTRAVFIDADLRNADIQAVIIGDITFINTICPDGTKSEDDPGGVCAAGPPP